MPMKIPPANTWIIGYFGTEKRLTRWHEGNTIPDKWILWECERSKSDEWKRKLA
jgi:hypothetical protein